ncbi:MAG: caspase family protein [Lachnospiraceae bacterium]|nr:caspase family protein [Lachnospiraceae bacterium]
MTKAERIKKEKKQKAIGENCLFAVGINKYLQNQDCLDNCEQDATLVHNVFAKSNFLAMSTDSCLLISDDEAKTSKKAILDMLHERKGQFKKDKNIIFYYSGHGCTIDGEFYFFVSDSEKNAETMISLKELLESLKELYSGDRGSITVLIDACCERVGNKKGLQVQSDNYVLKYLKMAKGMGVIFSCTEGEYSLDCFNNQEISVFTSFLLDALKGQARALDGNFLTFASLYKYIEEQSNLVSMSNSQIKQHPTCLFEGKNIIYAIVDDEDIKTEQEKHQVFSFREKIEEALSELRFQISSAIIEKCIVIGSGEDGFNPSQNCVYMVCKELKKMGYLYYGWEKTLNNLYYYSAMFENGEGITIPYSVQKVFLEDMNYFLNSIPTYTNDFFEINLRS